MPQVLKNKNLEIQIDFPEEGYSSSRFDWTGKITQVAFKGITLSISEKNETINDADFGKGFYNEFGIDSAIGFAETAVGDWFHKIGIGLLQKQSNEYHFHKRHNIKPAKFEVRTTASKVKISCTSETVNGYSYRLKKEIVLLESGFEIKYNLENTGEKEINTSEYVHNFMAIDNQLMGSDYRLKLPFQLMPELFKETVNTEQRIVVGENEIAFKGTPNEQFFFSFLSGDNEVNASWELVNEKCKIGISEIANFKTRKVNIWGWKHVISPELFISIVLQPGELKSWSRVYNIFDVS